MLRPSRSEEKTRAGHVLCVLSLAAFELSWIKEEKGRDVGVLYRNCGICRYLAAMHVTTRRVL